MIVVHPGDIAAGLKPGETAAVPVEILQAWQTKLHDAFDLGFKAAGGTMIPDGARNTVELALDRETINVLAEAAEHYQFEYSNAAEAAIISRFLETISIYRSK